MGMTEDIRKVTEGIVSSYQARISQVVTMVDNTNHILEDFRMRRNKMSCQLKETLAKEESLRRKDFDNMINGVLSHQDMREKEVRVLLDTFFEEQKEIAEIVKKSLTESKRVRIDDFRKSLQNIQDRQKVREKEIKTALLEFQEEYKEIVVSLSSLLDKEEEVRIKDFKEMVGNIRVWQKNHAEEIRNKLGGLRKKKKLPGYMDIN